MVLLSLLFSFGAGVWAVPMLRGRSLLTIVTIALTATVLLGPSLFAIDGPIQVSIDRLLLFGMAMIFLFRWRLGAVRFASISRIDCVLAGFVALLLFGALRGENIPGGTPPVARWLFFIFCPFIFYFVSRHVRLLEQQVQLLANVLTGLGLYLAVMAIFETQGLRGLVFPRYINDPDVWEFYGRGRGPLLNPAGNGILMTLALTATASRSLQAFGKNRLQATIQAGLTAIIMAGCYLTFTRSVWMGAIVALGIVAVVQFPRWVRALGLATAVLLAICMTMGLKDQLLSMKRDKNLSAADAAKSVELRPLLAIVAFEMFKDRPIMGHGFGQYMVHASPYHTIRSHRLPLEDVRPYVQHNVFLSILVDAGLLGLSAFLAFIATLTGMSCRLILNRKPGERLLALMMLGYLAAYVCNGLFHDVGVIETMNTFLFAMGGMVVATFYGDASALGSRLVGGRTAGSLGVAPASRAVPI